MPSREKGVGFGANPCWGGSIREFCRLDMPVIMFDKDENFVVLTLEEVCRLL